MAEVRLSDYRPAPQLLERTDLTVQLHTDHTEVAAKLVFCPNPLSEPGPLRLMGVDLELLELHLDGAPLTDNAFSRHHDHLEIHEPPERPFLLESRVRIRPSTNSTLEGLYVSGGLFTTQCEAEGFRRITFHPDRPDLLSRFRVRIEADRDSCPVLLSNGNCIETGELPDQAGRHYALWDDPFPKPSYLFALVAGRLEEVNDSFVTSSGRRVLLRIHVEPGDAPYTGHAMASLKRAMAWDEQRYGLEYDLDQYNVVAVRHFNMGAMENKSLNIFNSKLVLADAETATDSELERIESVIAHEYFHNWTGNRITCRDWFQLSLKEGLTVFRDQEFTADQHGAALSRIGNVAVLRNSQFREDAGPTAHPVQPDRYQAIDNFYTTTIYEKGAEVIRCLHTLLGEQSFMAGMSLYVSRHDGEAATCDDFLRAMEDGASGAAAASPDPERTSPGFDFQRFRRWYTQAGTPVLHVQRHWDGQNGVLELQIRQFTAPTPGQPEKQPLVLPLVVGLIDQAGEPLEVRIEGETRQEARQATLPGDWGWGSRLLVIDRPEHTLKLVGLPPHAHPPALSVLRRFSAPVRLELGRPSAELVHLLASDSDPFARWDAGQILLRQALLARARTGGRPEGAGDERLESELMDAYRRILGDPTLSEASRAALMAFPGLGELEDAAVEQGLEPDPPALFGAAMGLQRRFGLALAEPLTSTLERCRAQWPLSWPAGHGDRQLTAAIWRWRVAAGDQAVIAAAAAAVESPSMTLARAGLSALQNHPLPQRKQAMDGFFRRWMDRPVILDAWFALEAAAPFGDGLERVAGLLAHPRFDPSAPNSVRAVLGGLAGNAPVFHATDGRGYRFMAHRIAELDQRNPITASRLAKIFSRWRSYAPERRAQLRQALEALAEARLSTNTREVVEQCLAAG